jgi:hypothetical protein
MNGRSLAAAPSPGRRTAALALLAAAALWLAPAGPARAADAPSPSPPTLEIRPAPPPAAAPLRAWHRRYLVQARPVRAAMRRLVAARGEADPALYKRRYRGACAGLAAAVAPFVDAERRDELFPAAADDPAARYHLRRAYAALAIAAESGAAGRFQAAELAFAESARWFRQAARVLERYGLEP